MVHQKKWKSQILQCTQRKYFPSVLELQLSPVPKLDLSLSLVLADSQPVCLRYLSRRPVVNQLRASGRNWLRIIIKTMQTKKEKKRRSQFLCCLSQHVTWCQASKINRVDQSHMQSNAARKWCRQWTTTALIQCHPPWPGSCQSW